MRHQSYTRDEIVARLISAVPSGQRELTAADWVNLQHHTTELLDISAGSGAAELQRFLQLRDRSFPIDMAALARMHRGRVIVVTGGSGCIGSSLLQELSKLGASRLVSISRGVTQPWMVVTGVEYLHADIRDEEALLGVFRSVRPEIVYHLAAQHHPGLAEIDVAHTLSTNVTGSANVFRACRSVGSQIVHASTGKALRPFSRDIYAASKKMSEWLLAQAVQDGKLIGSAARFTHVVDNSIIYQRLREWTEHGSPIRLHSADSSFYLQSAREAAQLLLCAGLDSVPGEVTLGAIRDLGWPISLLDLAVGWLGDCQVPVPLYICGFEAGYDGSHYPALYDPRTSGDRSPLFNALESPGTTAFSRSTDVDICPIAAHDDLQTLSLITDLGRAAVAGDTATALRAQVAECGWAMLGTAVATVPTAILQRHAELVESIPQSAFDRDDLEVVAIITAELLRRSPVLLETIRVPIPSAATERSRRTPAMVASAASTTIEFDRMTRGLTTEEFPAEQAHPDELPAIRRPVGTDNATGPDLAPLTTALDIDDAEKISYFGPQTRWYLVIRFIAFAGLIASLLRFTYSDARISALLVVIIPLVVVSVISLYTSTRPRRMSLADHQVTVSTWPRRHDPAAPSVDVYLPTAGESITVLADTYQRVARMRYPGRLEVYVLDDGGRPEVEALAAEYGFTYLSRPNRGQMKKAGNLAYGYAQTTGDIIAVFDADFAPRPDYLLELVPYLDDATIGIVQSPAVLPNPRYRVLAPEGGRIDPGAVLPVGPAVPRFHRRPHLRRNLRPLSAFRAGRVRRFCADRTLRGRAYRNQDDGFWLPGPLRAGDPGQGPVPGFAGRLHQSAVPMVLGVDEPDGESRFPPHEAHREATPVLLERVRLLHHHRAGGLRDPDSADLPVVVGTAGHCRGQLRVAHSGIPDLPVDHGGAPG